MDRVASCAHMTGAANTFEDVIARASCEDQLRLQALRRLIHDVARMYPAIADLEETLKWGQPSFVVRPKGVGSTIRMAETNGGVSLFFICTTDLVARFKEIYPAAFRYVGNREIRFLPGEDIPEQELSQCISMALTYHSAKKQSS